MSAPIDDGGSAFPHGEIVQPIHDDAGNVTSYRVYVSQPGMRLRDWFAAQALAGYLAGRNNSPHETPSSYEASRVACDCYAYADAMLAARLTKPE